MAKHLQSESGTPGGLPRIARGPGAGLASSTPAVGAPRYIRLQKPANDNPAPLHLRLKWLSGVAVLVAAALLLAWMA